MEDNESDLLIYVYIPCTLYLVRLAAALHKSTRAANTAKVHFVYCDVQVYITAVNE